MMSVTRCSPRGRCGGTRRTSPSRPPGGTAAFSIPPLARMALSDHRVGIGLITTPLILGGVTPLAAHNVAFLLSYFLSAVKRLRPRVLADTNQGGRVHRGVGLRLPPVSLRASAAPRTAVVVLAAAGAAGVASLGEHIRSTMAGGPGRRPAARGLHDRLLLLLPRGPDWIVAGVVSAVEPACTPIHRAGGRAAAAIPTPRADSADLPLHPSAIRPQPLDHRDRGSQCRSAWLGDAAGAARALGRAAVLAYARGRGVSRVRRAGAGGAWRLGRLALRPASGSRIAVATRAAGALPRRPGDRHGAGHLAAHRDRARTAPLFGEPGIQTSFDCHAAVSRLGVQFRGGPRGVASARALRVLRPRDPGDDGVRARPDGAAGRRTRALQGPVRLADAPAWIRRRLPRAGPVRHAGGAVPGGGRGACLRAPDAADQREDQDDGRRNRGGRCARR